MPHDSPCFPPVRGAGPRPTRPSMKRWRGSFPFLFLPSPTSRIRRWKAGFTIFLVRKYLIWNVWATGNIVKKACSEDLPDSQGIVFVIESTSLCSFGEPEERQGAPLLEHRREQASRLRPSGAAACFVFGRDQFIPGGGLAQGGRGVRRRCGRLSDAGLVRRRPLRSGRGRRLGGAASPGRTAPASSAPMGRLLAGETLVAGPRPRSVLGRSLACEPEGNALGPHSPSLGHLSIDRAGKRVEAASRVVRPERHGRSARVGFRLGRGAQTLCLPRPVARPQGRAVLPSDGTLA